MKKVLFSSVLGLFMLFTVSTSAFAATVYWPTNSERITSPYGPRDIGYGTEFHYGIDIGASRKDSNGNGIAGDPIRAMHNGVVRSVGWTKLSGNIITITHAGTNQINGYDVVSYYTHLEQMYATTGNFVYGNSLIGTMGDTGERVRGVHLHFETRIGTSPAQSDAVNPTTWYHINPYEYIEDFVMSSKEGSIDMFDPYSLDNPDYYPLEVLEKMTPEELKEIGYPNPYEFQDHMLSND